MAETDKLRPFPEDILRENPKDYSLTLAKGMAILEMFGRGHDAVSYQSAGTYLGTSRATARRLILTLEAMGYLERKGKDYVLTGRPLAISRAYLTTNSILSILAEKVRCLAAKIDRPCSVVSMNGPDIMFLCRDPSRRVYASQLALGDRLPAHASSGGKLFLSLMENGEILEWYDRYKPQSHGSRTITDAQAMLPEVARIRKQGYAISDCELEEGLVSVGLPVRDHCNRIRLALVVSQFANLGSAETFLKMVLGPAQEAAEDISLTYADYLRHNA